METQKLDPEFKAKWVAALRSGEYKQGSGTMYNPDADCFCCLGVAGVVCGVPLHELRYNAFFTDTESPVAEYGYPTLLCNCVKVSGNLVELNDMGAPFSVIADYIEANL
jgi:hypothetical protein